MTARPRLQIVEKSNCVKHFTDARCARRPAALPRGKLKIRLVER
jgi:hypothetical protein